jgi:hypothetical protein
MPSEFELSIIDHAVASGRGANCFFQSFIHTLTNQSPQTVDKIEEKYVASTKALVDTFNTQLALEPPINFKKIMEISRQLHPLERECLFGPILRHTYNALFEQQLEHGPNAILFPDQTQRFANAFGAEINVYMSEEQFKLSTGGMPDEIASRIESTKFKINDRYFYRDCPPSQSLTNGEFFKLNIVYADTHLNYTLGTRALNHDHNRQIITERTKSKDGIFSVGAVEKGSAPLAKGGLTFSSMVSILCNRFNLTSTKEKNTKPLQKETQHAKDDFSVSYRPRR